MGHANVFNPNAASSSKKLAHLSCHLLEVRLPPVPAELSADAPPDAGHCFRWGAGSEPPIHAISNFLMADQHQGQGGAAASG